MTRLHRALAATALVAAAVSLAACSPAGGKGTAPATGGTAATDTPGTTAPKPTRSAGEQPTCENLISPSLDAQLKEQGWTFRQDPFYVGSTKLDAGIVCLWGDFSGPSNDNVQVFGYSQIDAAAAAAAETELTGQGWVREEGDGVVYITQDKKTAGETDPDGYGLTYEFGDGWVKYADTKLGLVLITWP